MGSPERAEILPVEPNHLWTAEDDELLLQLKWSDENLTWKEIADRFPRRTQGSCKKRYARILADMWDEQGKDRLANLYDSQKEKMWQEIAQEMNVPSKDAEQNHWRIGKREMEKRAGDKSLRILLRLTTTSHQQQPQTRTRGRSWSGEEEASLFDHRAAGKDWEDIGSLLPGRSVNSCPIYHERVLNTAGGWIPELQTDLSRLYKERKSEMWAELAEQLAVQWQSAEAMHWILGLKGMRERARFPQTPPNLMDCEPFDNCWETLMLNRDS
ncbi:hypothetical protein E4U56_005728 [Claviceps arundinis]|uniref:Myb-like domain-containing protein n=1 Tax=Claviceps arundinis TaxID=1623583 RepID=A0A9P7MML6_9HYPO|nr:hypothetical protein E4U56_005728 [Claviceps arundinis]